MFFHNRPLSVQRVDFRDSAQSVEQDREEQNRTLGEETGACIGGAVENGADDQCHDDVANDRCECGGLVVPDTLNRSFHVQFDLHRDGNDVGRFRSGVVGLGVELRGTEFLELPLIAYRELLLVSFDFLLEVREVRAGPPVSLEVVCCAWNLLVEAVSGLPLRRVRNTRQEVACRLSGRAVPAHLLEVLLGAVDRAKENLAARI